MKKILFVCHGNICRSIMAECIFKKLLLDYSLEKEYYVDSAATSREEIGNAIYPPAKQELIKNGIPIVEHYAKQVTKSDYDFYDLILCMDDYNIRNISRIVGDDKDNKIKKVMDFVSNVSLKQYGSDVVDPWYSGDFKTVFAQLMDACQNILKL